MDREAGEAEVNSVAPLCAIPEEKSFLNVVLAVWFVTVSGTQ